MNLRTLISSIFSKTKSDINNEKRQRVTADNNLQSQITTNANAISAIEDGANIDSFADVETALNSKQDTLTAGTNIVIQNNVISASGGEVHLYEHRVSSKGTGAGVRGALFFVYLDSTNTPCTTTKMQELFHGDKENARQCHFVNSSGTEYGALYTQSNMENVYAITGIQSNANLSSTLAWGTGYGEITDTIRKIF